MSKTKKIILAVAILVVVIFLIWLGYHYFQQKSPEYQAEKYIKEMEQKYWEDIYGGSTPEETLQLFIDALKKGDIDLASKYFAIDKQEEWIGKLNESKKLGNIAKFVSLLEKIDTKKDGKELSKGSYQFIYSLNSDTPWIIDLAINQYTNRWKIESL